MTYQVLARKWRPHVFKDVVGQSHVLTALANALDHDRLHHAYLFSGTRGVGKTTIARIFAKGLNCEQGVTSTPCGQCSACVDIDEGRFVDLLEIDAASRTKVEDTRDLLDNVQYKPARGRFKVYLIDEVHMLSRHSFNALLKTLEEPPEYVKFLLATTDPQKLPVTILSRCLQFHLKHLDAGQIHHQLSHILAEEAVTSEDRALSLISRAAEGSMRDALSLTDQAIALGNGAVNETDVTEMLGTLSIDQALLLLEALVEGTPDVLMQCLEQLAEVGVEWDGLLRELAAQLHRIAMAQTLPASVDISSPDAERVTKLSKDTTPQDIQLFYQIALQGRQDLPYAPDGRAGLEMVLLRMLAFRPAVAGQFEPTTIEVPASEPTSKRARPAEEKTLASQQVANQGGQSQLAALKAQVANTGRSEKPPVNPPVKATSAPEPTQPSQASQHAVDPQLASHMAAMEQMDQLDDENPSEDLEPAAPVNRPTEQPKTAPTATSASTLVAARNMLRSRVKKGDDGVKKTDRVSAPRKNSVSVLDRIADKHKPMDPALMATTVPDKQDLRQGDYQWQAKNTPAPEKVAQLTPKKIKSALSHERTPEMREKLVYESRQQDTWCEMANALDIARLVKQMALNASMERHEDTINLYLRPEQAHLKTDNAVAQLAQALSEQVGSPISLNVELGQQGKTPLEWRDDIYAGKLAQASQSLSDDPNIRFICQRFSAEVDEDSIRPI
ncbi:DNA polymerase III subunit gamma/tau [Veronia pacifica]|uniref:DNA polymerase III subunit gamma/tau n=1 Tax=Veronia pacifica TaxID=1080227 RepID=A0A1C3ERD9_9GAMM|nr:DNA polymerase III subunit gamma/tau [Veronia pacifica]ODA35807.1 DNA polymerase III subunit gamma/tau [Veronia pacifica]